MEAVFADSSCIHAWMQLVRKVSWNFPGLETEASIVEHEQTVLKFMGKRQALCVQSRGAIIGVLLFSRGRNMICFLAVDPDDRKQGVASLLMSKALDELDRARPITVSTFRENDEKGRAPRALYRKIRLSGRRIDRRIWLPQSGVCSAARSFRRMNVYRVGRHERCRCT